MNSKIVNLIIVFLIHTSLKSQVINSIFMEVEKNKIYIFNREYTNRVLRVKKECKFLNYWQINECDVNDIITKNSKCQPNDETECVYQLFPFIDKKGNKMCLITISLISKDEYKRKIDIFSSQYRSVFDGNRETYFSFVADMSYN